MTSASVSVFVLDVPHTSSTTLARLGENVHDASGFAEVSEYESGTDKRYGRSDPHFSFTHSLAPPFDDE